LSSAPPADPAGTRPPALFRCSIASEAAGEPMLGTASTIDRWLLLEHGGPWGADALRDARLPATVRAYLRRAERELGIRVLLVRRPDRSNERRTTTVAAVSTGPADPWIERIDLADPSAVPGLDLEPLASGASLGWDRDDRPAFVVCTQGRRDPCCAERGRPLVAALARRYPDETWESTHVGGDRFAGNLVVFPEGLYFGRVASDDVGLVASAYLNRRIDLTRFRGRACYPMDVQAAEQLLRVDRGWDGIADVVLAAVERDARLTQATFDTPDGAVTVSLHRSRSEPRQLTCHAWGRSASPRYEGFEISS
jgi:hypothetical protein